MTEARRGMAPWTSDTPFTTTVELINQSEAQVTGGMSESILRSTMVLTGNIAKRKHRSTIPPAIIQVRTGKARRITSPSTHTLAILELLAITPCSIVTGKDPLQVIIRRMDHLSITPAIVVDTVRIVTRSSANSQPRISNTMAIPGIIPRRYYSTTQTAVLTQDHGKDTALKSATSHWQTTLARASQPYLHILYSRIQGVLQNRRHTGSTDISVP